MEFQVLSSEQTNSGSKCLEIAKHYHMSIISINSFLNRTAEQLGSGLCPIVPDCNFGNNVEKYVEINLSLIIIVFNANRWVRKYTGGYNCLLPWFMLVLWRDGKTRTILLLGLSQTLAALMIHLQKKRSLMTAIHSRLVVKHLLNVCVHCMEIGFVLVCVKHQWLRWKPWILCQNWYLLD